MRKRRTAADARVRVTLSFSAHSAGSLAFLTATATLSAGSAAVAAVNPNRRAAARNPLEMRMRVVCFIRLEPGRARTAARGGWRNIRTDSVKDTGMIAALTPRDVQ